MENAGREVGANGKKDTMFSQYKRPQAESGEISELWTTNFLCKKGNEILCRIDDEFLLDPFNWKELEKYVPNCEKVIQFMTMPNPREILKEKTISYSDLHILASLLYGLLHSRYIHTPLGMKQMLVRYQKVLFSICPRVMCENQPLLPIGVSECPNISPVRFYCPQCQDLYYSHKSRYEEVDGAWFGPSFPQMFLLNFPEIKIKPKNPYVPTIYGFRLHPSCSNHPPQIRYSFEKRCLELHSIPVPFFDPSPEDRPKRAFISSKFLFY